MGAFPHSCSGAWGTSCGRLGLVAIRVRVGTAPAPGDELRRLGRGGLRGSRRGLSRISAPLRAARFSSRNNVPAVPAIFASRARARGLGTARPRRTGSGALARLPRAVAGPLAGSTGSARSGGGLGRWCGSRGPWRERWGSRASGSLGARRQGDDLWCLAKSGIGTAAGFGGFLRLCRLLRLNTRLMVG